MPTRTAERWYRAPWANSQKRCGAGNRTFSEAPTGFAICPFQGYLLHSVAPYNLRGISIFTNTYIVHWGNGHRPRKHAHFLTRWPNHGGQVISTLLVDDPNAPSNLAVGPNLYRGSQSTDSRTVRTGPLQPEPIRPNAHEPEKGSRG